MGASEWTPGLKVSVAEPFEPLLVEENPYYKYRYLVWYGGRGSGKTVSIAKGLLIRGMRNPERVLCAREFQNSISDSVLKSLEDEIDLLDLREFYTVQNNAIYGANGTEFIFRGLKSNIQSIKSMAGITLVWLEEGQVLSERSYQVLIPTIREEGSQIIISFNPELEDDPTYQRFIVSPPENSHVVKVNHDINPWFPEVLKKEMQELKKKNYQEYLHVWEGHPKQAVEGAIFAEEIRLASEQNRLTRIPLQSGVPVQTFWDLGQSDNTAIWFVQIVGMEYRLLDYYQASGHKMPHYIEVLADRGYNYDEHCLPHDAEHDQLAAKSTIKQQLVDALRDNAKLGKTVRIVPRIPKKALGIDAARSIFDQCIFDKQKTADGIQCLRHYAYAKDDETGRVSKEPKHDIWSHGADAFLCFAQHFKRSTVTQKIEPLGIKRWR